MSEAIFEALDFAKGGGLVTAIAQDDETGEVLMVAHVNEESLRHTLASGYAVYWSRSRGLWKKGEQSGHLQRVRGIFVDCDGDAVLLRVEQQGGAACHTGMRSCFFRRVEGERLVAEGERVFDPEQVYR
jgi:phosphoribosyl-AMP cyclohydrolase